MSFQRSVKSEQRRMRLLSVAVDGTGTASLGGSDKLSMTLTDNGVGDYTLSYGVKFARAPEVHITPITANIVVEVFSSSTSACVLRTFANTGGAAADADFNVLIIGSDASEAI